jgi:hypothetical protein
MFLVFVVGEPKHKATHNTNNGDGISVDSMHYKTHKDVYEFANRKVYCLIYVRE